MIIGCATIELSLGGVFSLKEKRQILKSLIAKIKNKFNVSIAEVDKNDQWQIAVIGICCVTNASAHADSELSSVIRFIENDGRVVVLDFSTEIL